MIDSVIYITTRFQGIYRSSQKSCTRIILGVALIMYATESKYPKAILIIGWISIVAASVLGIMGRPNFRRLMSWALSLAPSFGRIGGFLAILFGGFLIHAVV